MNILDSIQSREDLLALDETQTKQLCEEIRRFLIDHVAHTGGHLASNLGVVELTVAIHKVFQTDKDRLVFDVGHQCYVHKILTGRKDRFDTLRQYDGLAGFPKPYESEHDAFIVFGRIELGAHGEAHAEILPVVHGLGAELTCARVVPEAYREFFHRKVPLFD